MQSLKSKHLISSKTRPEPNPSTISLNHRTLPSALSRWYQPKSVKTTFQVFFKGFTLCIHIPENLQYIILYCLFICSVLLCLLRMHMQYILPCPYHWLSYYTAWGDKSSLHRDIPVSTADRHGRCFNLQALIKMLCVRFCRYCISAHISQG